MNWISVGTLLISALTLIMVVVQLLVNTKQRKIDREIEVTIGERRRMQQELFKNVLGILEIDRELEYEKFLKEKNILFHQVLNYKIGVWINLNRENSFYVDLRRNCNSLATWIASALETANDDNEEQSYFEARDRNRQHIWILIDKYIEEEERLVKLIVAGKKLKRQHQFKLNESKKIHAKD
ncbi:hypothetical protein [Clostridium tunisiense]|uniref:hypothetical protein n=1 Tax=Clostridium tunisiense TaxID=219748 RepID=UPI0002E2D99C|nr:hypothetical protein [Clostridium tunisiense]